MLNGKVSSILATTVSVVALKLAIQHAEEDNMAQLFEILFVIWGSYAVICILYLS